MALGSNQVAFKLAAMHINVVSGLAPKSTCQPLQPRGEEL